MRLCIKSYNKKNICVLKFILSSDFRHIFLFLIMFFPFSVNL